MLCVTLAESCIIKTFIYLIICVATLFVAYYLYVYRDQSIRIDYIPAQFLYCKKTISEGDQDYDELVKVLIAQKDNWTASSVSYAPIRFYYSPKFQVTIPGKMVVVSYETNSGFTQLTKLIKYPWPKGCEIS